MNEQVKTNTAAIIAGWQQMTQQQQLDMVKAAVKKAGKFNGSNAYIVNRDSSGTVQDAFVCICTALANDGEQLYNRDVKRLAKGLTITPSVEHMVYMCVQQAINAAYHRHTHRDRLFDNAVSFETPTGRGNSDSETTLGTILPAKSNLEHDVIIRDAIDRVYASLDPTNKAIVDGLRDGLQLKEIAEQLGISAPAVGKRRDKIRDALREALAA